MNVLRKISKGAVAALVALAALGVVASPAWATGGNTTDTSYSFSLTNNPIVYRHTEQRPKYTDSTVYVKADTMTCSPGVYYATCSWTLNFDAFSNNTKDGYAYMPQTLKGYNCNIRNYVYENGWPGCGLWARTAGTNGILAGVWSPDASGVWNVLNP